jgi:hypothetical protein
MVDTDNVVRLQKNDHQHYYHHELRSWPVLVTIIIIIIMALQPFVGAGIAQSVERLATGWTTRGSGSPGRVKNFHFSISSRPALGSTQPPIKWVPGALSWG